jgi:hypothetical protein
MARLHFLSIRDQEYVTVADGLALDVRFGLFPHDTGKRREIQRGEKGWRFSQIDR